MRRVAVAAVLGALALGVGPIAVAAARTETAHLGAVTATLSFKGRYPRFSDERLSIARAGRVVYNRPVHSALCGAMCDPLSFSGKASAVHAVDLEPGGEPSVVLDLYSGGAHCCSIAQVFSYDPAAGTYAVKEHDFGDPGYRFVDLQHNGLNEFLTADDSFAYEFTDFAASGMPIQILVFSDGRFRDVTRSYPRQIAKDAAGWLKAFKRQSSSHYADTVGVIAAWAADEDLLGHEAMVNRFLRQQAKAGHLNSALGGGGKRFVTKLKAFLRRRGYLG
jgi:hypothetical protein